MVSARLSNTDDIPPPPENSDVLLKLSSEEFPADKTWKTAGNRSRTLGCIGYNQWYI